MKTKTNQQSAPPASAGGLTEPTGPAVTAAQLQPHTTEADIARLTAENAELKAAVRMAAAKEQIIASLGRAGARSPSLLFDAAKSDLQFADDGALTNSAAFVERLTRDFPEQFGTERPASIDAGQGRTVTPVLTRDALSRMSATEIAKLDWAEVRNVLAAG